MGVCIIAGMLFMVYRNPGRAKELLLSFLSREIKLLLSTSSEIWDIVGRNQHQLAQSAALIAPRYPGVS
jgi:hypothetical protein